MRTFAQHKDDRRKVEKALEASGLPAGKVTVLSVWFNGTVYWFIFPFVRPTRINPPSKDDTLLLAQFTFDDFYMFYKALTNRQEVEAIFEDL